jgi:hypothetical protein
MLQCYLNALLPSTGAGLAPKTQPLVFRIALDHLCSFLWREIRLGEHSGESEAADARTTTERGEGDADVGEQADEEEKKKRCSLVRALFSPTQPHSSDLSGGAHPRLRDYLIRYDLRRRDHAAQHQSEREGQREEIPLLPEEAAAGSDANRGEGEDKGEGKGEDEEGERIVRARRDWLREVLEN